MSLSGDIKAGITFPVDQARSDNIALLRPCGKRNVCASLCVFSLLVNVDVSFSPYSTNSLKLSNICCCCHSHEAMKKF